MTEIAYPGSELELFAQATNWKRYWSSMIRPYLGRRVLDVGAGIGATIDLLRAPSQERWVALEPDPDLAARLVAKAAKAGEGEGFETRIGTIADLGGDERFDTILYIDVLEHIPDDRAELARAAARLEPGGRVIVLSPAHQWLFSPFDAAIGHERRYTRSSLRAVAPDALACERLIYLDSVGMILSLANRLLLRSAMPTAGQIAFSDRRIVPVSRILDRLAARRLGKTVIGIWRRSEHAA